MLIKFRIKRLEKKLNKLRKQHRKNDEIIKFLGAELYKVVDDTYDIECKVSRIKSVRVMSFDDNRKDIKIENIQNNWELSTKLD